MMDEVLNWLWQGSVVALACALLLRALMRARANVRYVVCWAALLLVICLPLLASLPTPLTASAVSAATLPGEVAIVSLPSAWWTSALVIAAAWAGWSGACTVRLVTALVALRRARARTRPFPSSLESRLPHWNRVRLTGRRPLLVVSDSVSTAAALGWGTPMIAVAPSLLTTLEVGELDRIVIHEWAHVQRRDDLVNVLQIALRVVAGWHPAVWWIDRRLHVEREIACDEMTVTLTGSPKSYAACLLKLAGLRAPVRALQTAPAIFPTPGLRARVTQIVAPRRGFAPVWSRTLAAAIVVLLGATSASVGQLTLIAGSAPTLGFDVTAAPALDSVPRIVEAAPATAPSRPLEIRRARRAAEAAAQQPERPAPPSSSPPVPASSPEPVKQPDASAPPSIPAAEAGAPAGPGDELRIEPPAEVIAESPAPPSTTSKPEADPTPWGAAADAGKTVGRKSRDAGVATAGFFNRVARRVAGSF